MEVRALCLSRVACLYEPKTNPLWHRLLPASVDYKALCMPVSIDKIKSVTSPSKTPGAMFLKSNNYEAISYQRRARCPNEPPPRKWGTAFEIPH
jgi:hypothetical protein